MFSWHEWVYYYTIITLFCTQWRNISLYIYSYYSNIKNELRCCMISLCDRKFCSKHTNENLRRYMTYNNNYSYYLTYALLNQLWYFRLRPKFSNIPKVVIHMFILWVCNPFLYYFTLRYISFRAGPCRVIENYVKTSIEAENFLCSCFWDGVSN